MARPIKPTPTLRNEDVKWFCASIAEQTTKYDREKEQLNQEAREVYAVLRKKWHTIPSTFE